MKKNNFEIEINASIEKVWLALTNSIEFAKWMKNVSVLTDWKKGSKITYTCFDDSGKVMQWNGMDMIWQGNIKTIEEHKEFTCVYTKSNSGLIEESYLFEKLDVNKTKLVQVQIFTTEKIADDYKEGTSQALELLKNHLKK